MTAWSSAYPQATQPALQQIEAYVDSPHWSVLCTQVQTRFGAQPVVEFSKCAGAPGWNVKYKKGARSLCVLYPAQGFFTCLICLGERHAQEAALALSRCTAQTQALYARSAPLNGTRWLMLDVTDAAMLQDALRLLEVRAAVR